MVLQTAMYCEIVRPLSDGKMDVLGIFDTLKFQKLPETMRFFFLFMRFYEQDPSIRNQLKSASMPFSKDCNLTIVLTSPSGREVTRGNQVGKLGTSTVYQFPTLYSAFLFNSTLFTENGDHALQIVVDGRTFAGPTLVIRDLRLEETYV